MPAPSINTGLTSVSKAHHVIQIILLLDCRPGAGFLHFRLRGRVERHLHRLCATAPSSPSRSTRSDIQQEHLRADPRQRLQIRQQLLQRRPAAIGLQRSRRAEPASGAQEAYVVYRHTLDIGKLRGVDIASARSRASGITARLRLEHQERRRLQLAQAHAGAGPDPDVERAWLPQHQPAGPAREQCTERRLRRLSPTCPAATPTRFHPMLTASLGHPGGAGRARSSKATPTISPPKGTR